MTYFELTPENWFRERNKLNHDWLGSVFFLEVSALRGRCLGETSGSGCLGESISATLNEWRTQKDRVAVLIETCESCTSPAFPFNHPPLSRCEADVLEWLPNLIHQRWLAKYAIFETTVTAKQWLRRADEAANAVDVVFETVDYGNSLLAGAIDAFLTALIELSKAIGRLPKRMLLT